MTLAVSLVFIVLALATTGCATRRVGVARGVTLELLTPAALGAPVAAVQKVEAQHGKERFVFLTQVEIEAGALTIAGLLENGGRAFLLTDDGTTIHVEQHALAQQRIPAKYLLADLQLLYWPHDRLAAAMRGGRVVDEPGRRTVYRAGTRGTHGAALIRIAYDSADPWRGVATYEHLERGYRLTIRSQVQDE